MVNGYFEAKEKILENFPDSEIVHSMKMSDGFLFCITPIGTKDYVLDGFFKVNSKNDIEEYSPVMNPTEFKECQKCIIE